VLLIGARLSTVADAGVVPRAFRPVSQQIPLSAQAAAAGGATSASVASNDVLATAGLNVATDATDAPNSSILVQCYDEVSHRKAIYFSGPPDSVVTEPDNLVGGSALGPNRAAAGNWGARFDAFMSQVQGGNWAFRYQDEGAAANPTDILDYMQDATSGLIQLTVSSSFQVQNNQRLQIFKSRMKYRGEPGFNRMWSATNVIVGSTTTTFELVGSQGLPFDDVTTNGIVRLVAYEYGTIVSFNLSGQASRKRGRPYKLRRGRAQLRRG
jgi:hypothetical protein